MVSRTWFERTKSGTYAPTAVIAADIVFIELSLISYGIPDSIRGGNYKKKIITAPTPRGNFSLKLVPIKKTPTT